MLSYQSYTEKDFYDGIKKTIQLEIGEFAGGKDPLYQVDIDQFPLSINRESRLQELLDSLLIELNNLPEMNVLDKVRKIENYLNNANNFREVQLKDVNTLNGTWKYIANQNLGFMNKLIKLLEGIKQVYLPNKIQQGENEKDHNEDNFLLSTIENKLSPFKNEFNKEKDYNEAIKLLKSFFLNEKISINKPLFIKNGNVRNMAFALGEIWRTQKNEPINYEYLNLYKLLFSIFTSHKVEKTNIFGCPLYKYSISKT
jgi:hypothetical protein